MKIYSNFDEMIEENQQRINSFVGYLLKRWYSHLDQEEVKSLVMLACFDIFKDQENEKYRKYQFFSYLKNNIFFYSQSKWEDFKPSTSNNIGADLEGQNCIDTFDRFKDLETSDFLSKAMNCLSEQEKNMIKEYDFNNHNYRQCGVIFNCSYECARLIRLKALDKMKKYYNEHIFS